MTPFQTGTIALSVVVFQALAAAPAIAQPPAAPLKIGEVAVSGSFRTRAEAWNWFGDDPGGDYMYSGSLLRLGLAQSKAALDWQVEFALPFVLELPSDAVAPGAAGALGLGANYFTANGNEQNAAELFVKQAAVRFKGLAGVPGQSLRVGRFEFIDGTETVPKDATLAAVKRDRIAHRLIGNFGFSHVGRSVDGAQYGLERGDYNVTAVVFRPTRGVYDVDGWGDLDVNVVYGALTRRFGPSGHAAEWRAFAIGYDDYRDNVLKVDNRALAARRLDASNVAIATIGGHYVRADKTPAGIVDLLVWSAWQSGSWGTLTHRARAFAAEGGIQPDVAWSPWFRGGINHGAGDDNPADGRHETFFQVLPTPRMYSRLPFYNLMNSTDAFGEAIAHPSHALTLRGDVHALRLASANDLWYQGGGAFQPATFGFTGRPSNGHAPLATLTDVSADVAATSHLTATVYYGYATGRAITESIYGGAGARFAYFELLVRF